MIDIIKAKTAFDNYVSAFDMDDDMIKLKYDHTFRVCEQSEKISESLNLNEEDTHLSYLIALLHDIGRFEQSMAYKTFNDSKSVDHAELGCQILFDKGLIREFIEEDSYDEIIRKAIMYHNKYSIPNGLDEREMMHAKIIRDIDKIDIMYNAIFLGQIKVNSDNSPISDEVRRNFFENKSIEHSIKKTKNDNILTMIAFIFDLNYEYSAKYFKDNRFIELFNEKINNDKIFDTYIKYAINYLEGKCKNARGKILTQTSRRRKI